MISSSVWAATAGGTSPSSTTASRRPSAGILTSRSPPPVSVRASIAPAARPGSTAIRSLSIAGECTSGSGARQRPLALHAHLGALGVADRFPRGWLDQEQIPLPGLPCLAQVWEAEIEVGPDLAQQGAEIEAQLLHRRSAPVPITVVDLEDPKPWPEHEPVRDHRVVYRVGVLLDV